jgi:hypothetical protein
MRLIYFVVFFIIAAINAKACAIEAVDRTATLRKLQDNPTVASVSRKDADSGEDIRRYIIDYADGPLFVLEQQDCEMRNLRLSILSDTQEFSRQSLERAGAILSGTEIWAENFGSLDARKFLMDEVSSPEFKRSRAASPSFSYSVDERLTAPNNTSETSLDFVSTENFSSQFKSMITFYIGVGGQH